MAKRSSSYWTAHTPKKTELERLRKEQQKAKRDLEALRSKEKMYQDIKKKQGEISALRRQQSKLGRLIGRATQEWKKTEKTRKQLIKEYKKL